MRTHDERNRGLGMTESSPLRFLTLAKVSEMTILCAHCLKAVEDLRGAVVMAGGTTQALERRVMTPGTLQATAAVPKPWAPCGPAGALWACSHINCSHSTSKRRNLVLYLYTLVSLISNTS